MVDIKGIQFLSRVLYGDNIFVFSQRW